MKKMISKVSVVVLFLAQLVHPQDYYTFAQQWPNGACMNPKKQCISGVPNVFTVHGLWPSNFKLPHPDNCSQSFNGGLINSLVSTLSTMWPNIETGRSNVGFWRYEWNKHGSCSSFSQYDYFNHAISLYSQNNLKAMLAAENIVPGTTHTTQEIINAIHLKAGVLPLLVCVNGNYLAEIHLCFDVPATKHINCPNPTLQTCSNSVIF